MAIAPSNNLLAALSQLQGNRPAPAAARPAAAPQGNTVQVGNAPSSFAAQLAAPASEIRTAVPAERPAFAASATPVNQPPIPARGGYLGRHVNIVV